MSPIDYPKPFRYQLLTERLATDVNIHKLYSSDFRLMTTLNAGQQDIYSTKVYDNASVEEYANLTTVLFLTEEQKKLNAPQKKYKFMAVHLHMISMYLGKEIVWYVQNLKKEMFRKVQDLEENTCFGKFRIWTRKFYGKFRI